MKVTHGDYEIDLGYSPELLHQTRSGVTVVVAMANNWNTWMVIASDGDTVVRYQEVKSKTHRKAVRIGRKWIAEIEKQHDQRFKKLVPPRPTWISRLWSRFSVDSERAPR